MTSRALRRGTDRSKPVSFLVSRLMSGSYVAFRKAGDALTEEAAVANRNPSVLYGDAAGDSAELLLHTEEQVRCNTSCIASCTAAQSTHVGNRSWMLRFTSRSSRRCAFTPRFNAFLDGHLLSPSRHLHAQALSERCLRGVIDLDNLEPDSPLVTMQTLDSLRFNGGPLDASVCPQAPVG